jgi:hypothetical protein
LPVLLARSQASLYCPGVIRLLLFFAPDPRYGRLSCCTGALHSEQYVIHICFSILIVRRVQLSAPQFEHFCFIILFLPCGITLSHFAYLCKFCITVAYILLECFAVSGCLFSYYKVFIRTVSYLPP